MARTKSAPRIFSRIRGEGRGRIFLRFSHRTRSRSTANTRAAVSKIERSEGKRERERNNARSISFRDIYGSIIQTIILRNYLRARASEHRLNLISASKIKLSIQIKFPKIVSRRCTRARARTISTFADSTKITFLRGIINGK